MLPTQLVPDDQGQYLRVRFIQKEGSKLFDPVYLFDEGSTIEWVPCGRKLTCSFPGAWGCVLVCAVAVRTACPGVVVGSELLFTCVAVARGHGLLAACCGVELACM